MKTFVCCLVLWTLLSCSSGFTDRDMSEIEASIKKNIEDKDFTVTEIKLLKESDRTLHGYVRIKKNVPSIGEMEFTKACTATMDENSRYDWRCE